VAKSRKCSIYQGEKVHEYYFSMAARIINKKRNIKANEGKRVETSTIQSGAGDNYCVPDTDN
jgi:hypothetical protein